MPTETVEVRGHLLDSLLLPKILDAIEKRGGSFDLERFRIGKRHTEASLVRIRVSAPAPPVLRRILAEIAAHGAEPVEAAEVACAPAPSPGVLPEGFYATTNLETEVFLGGRWVPVSGLEMDCAIVSDRGRRAARCVPMHRVRGGDMVVVGRRGIRVRYEAGREDPRVFRFMESAVSPEKPKGLVVRGIAEGIRAARRAGGKILFVGGPAIVHTGGGPSLERLIRRGVVDLLFAGNALAAHDAEWALYGTSLGVDLATGAHAEHGHENHLRAINRLRAAGGLRAAVRKGILRRGVFHACVRKGVDFVLAGSIRDDGPIPDAITDTVAAQDAMRERIGRVSYCLMVASTLHAVAVGNLLPASIPTVCVDINPAVVTKLTDRGSFQAIGIVTDAAAFLEALAAALGRGR